MMRERFRIYHCLLFVVLLFFAFSVFSQDANVYIRWPFSDADKNVSLSTASSRLNISKFWQEKIQVNGTELTLDISLVETSLKELQANLSKHFSGRKDVFIGGNSNSILLQEIQKDGSLKRQYYLELSGIHPVLLFEMIIPPGRRKHSAEDWPAELPLVNGAENMTSMKFPVRNAVYGAFSLKEKLMPQTVEEMTNHLEAMGWQKVSREADNVFEGTGEVFLTEDSSKLMILGVVPDADGRGVRVSMYTRPIK